MTELYKVILLEAPKMPTIYECAVVLMLHNRSHLSSSEEAALILEYLSL